MTDNVDDRITRLEENVAELRVRLDQDDELQEEHRKACEQVISLPDELGVIEILRVQAPPYRRHVVDRLEAALRLIARITDDESLRYAATDRPQPDVVV